LLANLQSSSPRNGIIVPIFCEQRTAAVLILLSADTAGRYGAEEAGIVLELASRIGLAMENQLLLQRAERASRAKSDFLAVVSHELRTPLASVIGYADLLCAGLPVEVPPKALQSIERIRTSAWHQLRLVEQILSYAQLDHDPEANIAFDDVVLGSLIDEAAGAVEPEATAKGLTLDVVLEDDFVVVTDAARLRQILLNLLANAIKFTPTGRIELRLRAEANLVRISVSDSGPGIPEEEIDHVFDPFWQGRPRDPAERRGIGLGLAISQKLASSLRARLSVTSTAGEGTTFTVELPTAWTG
jgi:signal transduction histidine kinase